MSKVLAGQLAALIALAGLPAAAHSWNSGDTAALIGGALLGGIAASAISNQHVHETQYVPAPPPPPRHRSGQKAPFSPAAGVVCYPAHWACYNNDGHFDAAWTNRVY
ncbi:MAG: hypothetical protein DI556_16990 [Rhodovulum sulfidophilum]|uniref:Uncharacterized protein n=1 Tax=Rhodovulum sulfidophilum TaxID=35806 RepID=A0A2W5N247_RHOSU|nr:MAG: hypothetical protein DI556_16990 [Rhodovulum sulfidophilum]